MERDFTWGGEYTIQDTYDVLQNCMPETDIINQYHTNKLNKNAHNFTK